MSAIVNVPLAAPAAEGVNVTLIEQVVPAEIPVPQLLVSAKVLGVMPMEVKESWAVPELVTVTDCAAL